MNKQALPIGSTLQDGKYLIKDVLGQGGFGITYFAEHSLLGTNVAIKEFFFKQFCDRDETTSRVAICTSSNVDEVKRFEDKFLKEARIIAKLDHPNIIKIHDVFRENNTAYYVMDFIEGDNLLNIATKRGGIPEVEAIGYIRQAGEALKYIHNLHLTHLDVKPANLMLRRDNKRVLLIDFGMSKQYDAISGTQTSTTPVGISHGYAPFEQYKEGGVGNFSPQTDIYALGATLFKLISGNTPPQAGDIINDGLPEFPIVMSQKTKDTISKAMEVRKVDRQSCVEEFLNMLPATYTLKSVDEETQIVLSHSSSKNNNLVNDKTDKLNRPLVETPASISRKSFLPIKSRNISRYVYIVLGGIVLYIILINIARAYIKMNYIIFNGTFTSDWQDFGLWLQ